MVFHIGPQIRSACAPMVPRAAVMHIAKGALHGVGPRTVGRHNQPAPARGGGQPLILHADPPMRCMSPNIGSRHPTSFIIFHHNYVI